MSLSQAWSRLPILFEIEGLGVRWLGPLVDNGHEQWLGDMSEAAWGYLEFCGWAELVPETPLLNARGEISEAWTRGLHAAAHRLADEGSRAGPESNVEYWLSWLCFALGEPNDYVRELVKAPKFA
jgi:hypothetical protein